MKAGSMSVDFQACAAYIQLTGNEVAETKILDESLNVDLDDSGEAIGVEVLDLKAASKFKRLLRQVKMSPAHVSLAERGLEQLVDIASTADSSQKDYMELEIH